MSLEHEARPVSARPSAAYALGAVLIALLGVSAFAAAAPVLAAYGVAMRPALYIAIYFAVQLVLFVVPAASYYRGNRALLPSLRVRGIDPLCAVLLILSSMIGMLALNQLTVLWTLLLDAAGLVADTGNSMVPTTPGMLWMMLAVVALAPAFCEEFLFRGLVLPALEPMGARRAVLISGVMFALLHGRLEALPGHILLGCVLGLIVVRTGSIVSAMLYHFVYNATLLVIAYFVARTNPEALETTITLAEGVASIPMTASLLAVWALLTYSAIQRGKKRPPKDILPPAARHPLSKTARWLMAVVLAALIVVELSALYGMLPGVK